MENFFIAVVGIAVVAFLLYYGLKDKKSESPVAKAPVAPAPTPVVKEEAQPVAKVKVPTAAELSKLTKKELDAKALEFGVTLDARKTKADMIKDLRANLK